VGHESASRAIHMRWMSAVGAVVVRASQVVASLLVVAAFCALLFPVEGFCLALSGVVFGSRRLTATQNHIRGTLRTRKNAGVGPGARGGPCDAATLRVTRPHFTTSRRHRCMRR